MTKGKYIEYHMEIRVTGKKKKKAGKEDWGGQYPISRRIGKQTLSKKMIS